MSRWPASGCTRELALPRLEWAAEVGNAASLRVAVKAGFAFEGRRRASLRQRDGSLRDGWWAARLPSDGPEGAPPALPSPGELRATTPDGRRLQLRAWRAEVGVWIAPQARRSGTATTAIAAMLAWAEPALGLARVEWHAAPDNAASLALAHRLSFVPEGVARPAQPPGPDGRRSDSVVLARLVG